VYAHNAEAHEYRHYIDYLQKIGYLTPDVEQLDLDELQEAQGLRALRVAVDLQRFPAEPAIRVAASIPRGAMPSGVTE
jgi:hypothetical protein